MNSSTIKKLSTILHLIDENPDLTSQDIAKMYEMPPRSARRIRSDAEEFRADHIPLSGILGYHKLWMMYSRLRANRDRLQSWEKPIYEDLWQAFGFDFSGEIRLGLEPNTTPTQRLVIGLPDCKEFSLNDAEIRFFLRSLQFRPLFKYCNTDAPLPDLAEYHWGDDLSHWVLKLHEDAKWNHGSPITAHDVIHTLRQQRQVKRRIREIRKVGKAIHIHLKEQNRLFPYMLSGLPILPQDGRATSSAAFQMTGFEGNSIFFSRKRIGNGNILEIELKCYTRASNCIRALEKGELDIAIAFQPFGLKEETIFQSQPLYQHNVFWALVLNRRSGFFANRENCQRLKDAMPFRAIERCFILNESPGRLDSVQLPFKLEYENFDSIRKVAELVGKAMGAPITPLNRMKEPPSGDALLMMMFTGAHHYRLKDYFGTNGASNAFNYSNKTVDRLICELHQEKDDARLTEIAEKIFVELTNDFAFIPVGQTYEHILSPLEFRHDEGLSTLVSIVMRMGDIIVERF